MATLDQLRKHFGVASDAEAIQLASERFGIDPVEVAREVGFDIGGKWGNRLSASVDSYQGNLYGLAEAVTGADWAKSGRQSNEAAAGLSRAIAQRQGAVMNLGDIGGVGDFFDYAGGLVVDSAPYLLEAVVGGGVGGLAARGLGLGAKGALAARTAGAVGASYPSAVGDILANQREAGDGNTMHLGAAALGGVPYAALNAFGLEGALARRGGFRTAMQGLDEAAGPLAMTKRVGANAGLGFLSEGASEAGQEVVNQGFGRMVANPDEELFSPDALARYGESFVGGGILGGMASGAAGVKRVRPQGLPAPAPKTVDEGSTDLLKTEFDAGGQGQLFEMPGEHSTWDPMRVVPEATGGATAEQMHALLAQAKAAEWQIQQMTAAGESAAAAGDVAGAAAAQKRVMQLESARVALLQELADLEGEHGANGDFRFDPNGPQTSLPMPVGALVGGHKSDGGSSSPTLHVPPMPRLGEGLPPLTPEVLEGVVGVRPKPTAAETAARRADFLAAAGEQGQLFNNQDQWQVQGTRLDDYERATGAHEAALRKEADIKEAQAEYEAAVATLVDKDPQTGKPMTQAPPIAVQTLRTLDQLAADGKITPEQHTDLVAEMRVHIQAADNKALKNVAKRVNALAQAQATPTQPQAVPTSQGTTDAGVPNVAGRGPGAGSAAGSPVAQGSVDGAGRNPAAAVGGTAPADGVVGNDGQVRPVQNGPAGGPATAVIGGSIDFDALNQLITDPRVRKAVRLVLGVDSDGTRIKPLAMAAAAEKAGIGANSHAAVSKAMKAAGITKEVRNRFLASDNTVVADVAEAGDAEESTGGRQGPALSDEDVYPDGDVSMHDAGFGTVSNPGQSQGRIESVGKGLLVEQKWYAVVRQKGLTGLTHAELGEVTANATVYAENPAPANRSALSAIYAEVEKRANRDPKVAKAIYDAYNKVFGGSRTKLSKSEEQADAGEWVDEPVDERGGDLVAGPVPSVDAEGAWQGAAGGAEGSVPESPAGPAPKVVVKKKRTIQKSQASERADDTYTKEDLEDDILSFVNAESLGRRVIIVDTAEDLRRVLSPKLYAEFMAQELGAPGSAVAFAVDGRAYMVADRIKVGEGRAVFMHEVGGHIGLERMLGKEQFARLARKVQEWAARDDGSQESEIAKKAMERAASADSAGDPAEHVAYFLEEAIKAGVKPTALKLDTELGRWVRAVWAAFKSALRKLGVKLDTLTGQDVVDLAYGAARLNLLDAKHGTGAKFYRYDGERVGDTGTVRGWGFYFTDSDKGSGFFADLKSRKTGKRVIASTDIAVQTNEWLDQTKPLAKQSRLVRDAIAPMVDELGLDPERTDGKQFYDALADSVGGRKAASLMLDAAGVKGSRYLMDADTNGYVVFNERNVVNALHDAENNTSQVPQFAKAGDILSAAFKRWFGDSVVKNAGGSPKVMYHGTGADIETFRPGGQSKAIFVTPDARVADGFASNSSFGKSGAAPNVMPVYVMAERPFDYTNASHVAAVLDAIFGKTGSIIRFNEESDGPVGATRSVQWIRHSVKDKLSRGDWAAIEHNKVQAVLRSIGHDGFYVNESGTKNLAVYSSNQLKSAIGNNGNYSRDDGRLQFSKTAKQGEATLKQVDRLNSQIAASMDQRARSAFTNISDAIKRYTPAWLTNFQLAEQFGKQLPALRAFVGLQQKMTVERMQSAQKVSDVAHAWEKLPQAENARLSAVMQDATMQGIHPDLKFDDELNAHLTPADRAKYDALAARYKALTQAAKDVYTRARDALDEQWKGRQAAYQRLVTNMYDERVAEAKATGATAEQIAEIEKARADAIEQYGKQLGKIKGPYFPLLRFGEYLAIGKSAKFKEAQDAYENATDEERERLEKELDQLKADPKHYVVSAYDNRAEQLAAIRKIKADGLGASEDLTDIASRASRDTIEHYVEGIRKELDPSVAAEMNAALTQVFLKTLPEMSALRREIERKNVTGASTDMLRSFAAAGSQGAFYTSRLLYAKEIANTLQQIKFEAKGNVDLAHVSREMQKRAALDMSYKETPIQDAISSASWIYHLGLSPSFMLMNMTQPLLTSLPVMAGRYGSGPAFSELKRSYTDALKMLKAARFKDGKWDAWSGVGATGEEDGKQKHVLEDRNERIAIREMLKRGIVDEGMQHELNMFADDKSRVLAKINRYSGWGAQQIELTNRLSTALAAYRLALPKMGHDAAVDYAYATTVKTQMDYSAEGTARVMREGGGVPLARLVFQFRRYQQGMLYLLIDNVKKIADPAERKEALQTLKYLTFAAGMSAGAMGLPFVGTAFMLANAFMDDDDDRGDAQTRFRNLMHDMFGKEMGTVLSKGLPAMFGADLSQRIGLGDIATPFPMARFDGVKTGRDATSELLFNLVGPAGGLASQLYDGVTRIANGDLQKGLEKLAPKVLADLGRGARYATEGMTDSKGEKIPNDIGGWEVFLRGVGVQSTTESNYYEGTKAVQDIRSAQNSRKDRIAAAFKNGLQGGDMSKARELIAEWNQDHPNDPIRPKDELAWRKQTVRSEKQRGSSGVKVDPKRDKGYADVARFAQ